MSALPHSKTHHSLGLVGQEPRDWCTVLLAGQRRRLPLAPPHPPGEKRVCPRVRLGLTDASMAELAMPFEGALLQKAAGLNHAPFSHLQAALQNISVPHAWGASRQFLLQMHYQADCC